MERTSPPAWARPLIWRVPEIAVLRRTARVLARGRPLNPHRSPVTRG
jgi:hypothetical protein